MPVHQRTASLLRTRGNAGLQETGMKPTFLHEWPTQVPSQTQLLNATGGVCVIGLLEQSFASYVSSLLGGQNPCNSVACRVSFGFDLVLVADLNVPHDPFRSQKQHHVSAVDSIKRLHSLSIIRFQFRAKYV